MEKGYRPALIVAAPVGFVNVVESKELLWETCLAPGSAGDRRHGPQGRQQGGRSHLQRFTVSGGGCPGPFRTRLAGITIPPQEKWTAAGWPDPWEKALASQRLSRFQSIQKIAPDISVQGHYSFPADLNVNGKEEISVQTMLIVVREKYPLFKFRMAGRTFLCCFREKKEGFFQPKAS